MATDALSTLLAIPYGLRALVVAALLATVALVPLTISQAATRSRSPSSRVGAAMSGSVAELAASRVASRRISTASGIRAKGRYNSTENGS